MSPTSHSHKKPEYKQPHPHAHSRPAEYAPVVESTTVEIVWVDCDLCNGAGFVGRNLCPRCLGQKGAYIGK